MNTLKLQDLCLCQMPFSTSASVLKDVGYRFKFLESFFFCNLCFIYKVRWVNFRLSYAKLKITLTSHSIWYIYQNYKKISWNNIDQIYSKKSPLDSTMTSSRLQNLWQAFLTVSLFKLVNATVIFAFSSAFVLHRVLLVFRLTSHNNQEDIKHK